MGDSSYEEFKQSKEYAKKHTTAIANEVIEAAPADADRRIILDCVVVGGDTEASIQFLDETNTAIDGYFWTYGDNGGVVLSSMFLRKLAKGKGLRYTQVGGGNWSILVKYHIEEGDYA